MERGHAEALLPLIDRIVSSVERGFSSLDRVAVTVGPGSYTGLRVGISAARGDRSRGRRSGARRHDAVGLSGAPLAAGGGPPPRRGDRRAPRAGLFPGASRRAGGPDRALPRRVRDAVRAVGSGPVELTAPAPRWSRRKPAQAGSTRSSARPRSRPTSSGSPASGWSPTRPRPCRSRFTCAGRRQAAGRARLPGDERVSLLVSPRAPRLQRSRLRTRARRTPRRDPRRAPSRAPGAPSNSSAFSPRADRPRRRPVLRARPRACGLHPLAPRRRRGRNPEHRSRARGSGARMRPPAARPPPPAALASGRSRRASRGRGGQRAGAGPLPRASAFARLAAGRPITPSPTAAGRGADHEPRPVAARRSMDGSAAGSYNRGTTKGLGERPWRRKR